MRPLPTFRAVAACILLLLPAAAAGEEAHLTILHTTDLHGALTGWDYAADLPAARGLTRIATLVRRVRAEGDSVLLLDAGDCIQGGGIETVYQHGDRARPDPMMLAMTRLGYAAMAVGNHEFDFGPDEIARARREAGFPWLAANIERPDGTPAFTPSVVFTEGPLRVGVVGLCTPAVPSFEDSAEVAGFRFLDPVAAARREVARLRERERCDVVVVLAHTGLGPERADPSDPMPDENWGRRIAAGVPGVDVLILGHTHVTVPSLVLDGALVTQAGKWGEHLGRVDLTLERDSTGGAWRVEKRRARLVDVADSTADDPELAALAAPYHAAAESALSQVIGRCTRTLDSPHGRLADGAVLDLIHRAQLEASGADVSLASLPVPSATIAPGIVTMRDVLRLYPYENGLEAVEMTGAELKQALERSATYFARYTYRDGAPLTSGDLPPWDFDTARGVSYEIDLTRPVGDRVLHLSRDGQPLDPDARLAVAVNSYRANGGGGFEVVRRAPRVWIGREGVREAIASTIRRAGTIGGPAAPNWTLLPDYVTAEERPLIDRLVRQGVAPREEVHRLLPDEPARRGDLAYWLARAFGWRERKLSGAFADAPDSLQPWLDGLLKRHVLGELATHDLIQPFAVVPLGMALDWCEAAARHEHYALSSKLGDPSFRRGLTTGVSAGLDEHGDFVYRDSLTHAQVMGLVANTRFPVVRVLETTDFHGAILPQAVDRRSGRHYGGTVALASHIEHLRAENPEGTVLLDGGDCFQGTMISNLQFGRPVVEQMNDLHYAAMAIGNHDFDWTVDTLARRIDEMHFSALGANLLERRTRKLPRYARADTMIVRRGVRIGVLGLCYVNTPTVTLPANVAHLRFADDSATAARLVPRLRKHGAGLVLVVGHLPAQSDSAGHARSGDLPRLAHGVHGVDAWFGGHSHNRVLDTIGGAPVMIAGARGQIVGVCDLVVDPVGSRVIERHARLVTTWDDDYPPDSVWVARVERWNSQVAPIAAQHVGTNGRRLTRGRPEATIGDLVADAMRDYGHADAALQNPGGLRADLPEGPITKGSIYEIMPFDNTIVNVELTGAELKRALEDGLRNGRVTQVSGIRYAYDPDAPPMQRVVELTDASGTPIDEHRTYRVAVNNFMATGGDNYDVLTESTRKQDTGVPIRETLEAYVRRLCANGARLDLEADGRIRQVHGGE